MKILFIGGTRFLGRGLVESALAGRHQVTVFHRGETNPGLFKEVEEIYGDRNGGLDVLKGRLWDAVVDTCGYYPRVVRESAELLKNNVDKYVFISTAMVYADMSQPNIKESAPLATMEDETVEEIRGDTYAPLKVLCEKVVKEYYPQKSLILRPGLIVGPYDPSDRFTYWVHRIAHGGQVLAPEAEYEAFQYIDARDLAAWILHLIESDIAGDFNAVGPDYPETLQGFLEKCREVLNKNAEIVWVDGKFITDNGVESWTDLPAWVDEKEFCGLMQVDNAKAVRAGLKFRDISETIRNTYEWCKTRPDDYEWKAGLKEEKETELLGKWFNRNG